MNDDDALLYAVIAGGVYLVYSMGRKGQLPAFLQQPLSQISPTVMPKAGETTVTPVVPEEGLPAYRPPETYYYGEEAITRPGMSIQILDLELLGAPPGTDLRVDAGQLVSGWLRFTHQGEGGKLLVGFRVAPGYAWPGTHGNPELWDFNCRALIDVPNSPTARTHTVYIGPEAWPPDAVRNKWMAILWDTWKYVAEIFPNQAQIIRASDWDDDIIVTPGWLTGYEGAVPAGF